MPIFFKKWAYFNFEICPKKKPLAGPQSIGYFLGGSPSSKIRGPPKKVGGPPFGGPLEKSGGPLSIWGPRGPQNIDNQENPQANQPTILESEINF